MRTVFIIDSLESGGAQRQAVELAVALKRMARVDSTFLIYRDEVFYRDRLAAAGIDVHVLRKKGKLDPIFPLRLRRWLCEHSVDVIHALLHPPCFWAIISRFMLSGEKRPGLICAERNTVIANTAFQKVFHTFIYHSADAVTVNSASAAIDIRTRCRVPEERIHYIPNGIDLAAWDDAMKLDPPVVLSQGVFNVGVIGRIVPQKNQLLLLRALSRLDRREMLKWRVWLIGAESDGSNYPARVRDEIERLGLSAIVTAIPATQRVASVMRQLDLLVLSSSFEGFPNVVLEAMSARIPVIATRVGDVPALVEDGESGFIVPPGDEMAVADALTAVRAGGQELKERMGAAGRAIVERRFSIEAVAQRYLALYDQVARPRSAGREGSGCAEQ